MAKTEIKKNPNKPLEYIDILESGEFQANGKTYFVEPELSIQRFREKQKLDLEIAHNTSFKKHYDGLKEMWDMLNELKLADATVQLRDILDGLVRLDDKHDNHPIFKYCALILNTKDEDRRRVDEKLVDEKINDWEEEGIPVRSFFFVALGTISGLADTLRENFPSSSSESNK